MIKDYYVLDDPNMQKISCSYKVAHIYFFRQTCNQNKPPYGCKWDRHNRNDWQIDSNPLANISWYDGERLLKTRTSTHTAILVLQNVSCLDTKNYTLVVSNVLQENVTAIVELIVNCKLQWYFKSSTLTKPYGMWCTLRILSANKKKLCNLKLKLKTLQTWFIWYFCQRLHYILMVVGLIYTCTCSFDFKLLEYFFMPW